MPILGVTDQAYLPREGKIHLGYRDEDNNNRPVATEYFVVPEVVAKALGNKKPKSLNVVFPSDDPEEIANAYYRSYSKSHGLQCRGNGVTARRLVSRSKVRHMSNADMAEVVDNLPHSNTNHPEMPGVDINQLVMGDIAPPNVEDPVWIDPIHCPGEECPVFQSKNCKRLMILQFMLPDVPGIGVWQIDSSSIASIKSVYGSLRMLKTLLGRIQGVPLTLELTPFEVNPEGRRFTRWMLNIKTAMTYKQLSEAPLQLGSVDGPGDDSEPPLTIPYGDDDVDTSTGEMAERPPQEEPVTTTTDDPHTGPKDWPWLNRRLKKMLGDDGPQICAIMVGGSNAKARNAYMESHSLPTVVELAQHIGAQFSLFDEARIQRAPDVPFMEFLQRSANEGLDRPDPWNEGQPSTTT